MEAGGGVGGGGGAEKKCDQNDHDQANCRLTQVGVSLLLSSSPASLPMTVSTLSILRESPVIVPSGETSADQHVL